MHAWMFHVATIWLVALAALVTLSGTFASSIARRVLALDVLAMVISAAMLVLAARHEEPGYLDVALVLALLGFVQTVATARLLSRRRERS